MNWRPKDVPLQFTPTKESYQDDYTRNDNKNDFFRGGEESGLMGNPLSRYRPMPMEEPIVTPDLSAKFPSKSFFNNNQKKKIHKRKHNKKEAPKRNVNTSKFPSFPSLTNEKNSVKPIERFPVADNFPNLGKGGQRNGLSPQRGGNQRNKIDNRKPQRPRQTTTPRPIPIPGKDFAFHIPHHVPSPHQPALPVHNPDSDYDRNFYDYEDTNEGDYQDDEDDLGSFDNDDKFSAAVGFMQNGGFGPSWEPSKLSKRRRKRAAPNLQAEGRSAASSIFWHNGQPIQPRGSRNRNGKNRRRNRQSVWGNRKHIGYVYFHIGRK